MDTARKLAHEEIPNFDDRCREQLDLSSKEKRWQQLEKFESIKDYALRLAYTPPYRLFEVLAYDYEKSEKAGWYDCAIILCLPNYWGYSMGKACKGILLTMLRLCDWFDVVIDEDNQLRLVLNLHITSNKDQGSFICRDMDIDNIKIDDPDVIFSLDRDITCEVLMDARKPKFSQELIESAPKVIKEKLLEKQKRDAQGESEPC